MPEAMARIAPVWHATPHSKPNFAGSLSEIFGN
jgi:hypothetical protein